MGAPAKAGRCVSQIAAGGSAACALLRDGTPWCWGSQPPGAHGSEEDAQDTQGHSPLPLRLLAGSTVELSMERNIAGTAWCWGHGTEGQLGTGRRSSARPLRVRLPCSG